MDLCRFEEIVHEGGMEIIFPIRKPYRCSNGSVSLRLHWFVCRFGWSRSALSALLACVRLRARAELHDGGCRMPAYKHARSLAEACDCGWMLDGMPFGRIRDWGFQFQFSYDAFDD